MASFKTHYNIGIFSSLMLFLPLSVVGFMSFYQMLICFFISLFGSLLPDIDIPTSRVAKFLFLIISIVLSGFMGLFLINYVQDYISFIVSFFTFIILITIMPSILLKITSHRGIIHSLPMIVVLVFAFSTFCSRYLLLDDFFSWICGISLGYGFFVHLLLDEMYSVDILGARFKKSFGTAIKLYDKKEPIYSILIYILILFQLQFLPSYDSFFDRLDILLDSLV